MIISDKKFNVKQKFKVYQILINFIFFFAQNKEILVKNGLDRCNANFNLVIDKMKICDIMSLEEVIYAFDQCFENFSSLKDNL